MPRHPAASCQAESSLLFRHASRQTASSVSLTGSPQHEAAALRGGDVGDVRHGGALRCGRQLGTEAVHGIVQVVSYARALPRILGLHAPRGPVPSVPAGPLLHRLLAFRPVVSIRPGSDGRHCCRLNSVCLILRQHQYGRRRGMGAALFPAALHQ